MNRYVLDSSVFMNLSQIKFEGELFSVEKVKKELKDNVSKTMFIAYKIKIYEPSKEAVEQVMEIAKTTGDINALSKADIHVLAAALELEAVVISDDFDIQNMAELLGLDFEPAGMEKISFTTKKRMYCPICKKYYSNQRSVCIICGNELVSKTIRKRKL